MTVPARRSSPAPAGREETFRALYIEHERTVRRIIFRLCHRDDLDDLVQQAFIKAYERLESLREEESARAWLCQIALNTARDHLRAKKRATWLRFFAPEAMPEGESSAPTTLDRLSSEQATRRALEALSPKLRETVTLFSLEELELTEIASILEVPLGTVKSRLNQAREKLRTLFGEEKSHE